MRITGTEVFLGPNVHAPLPLIRLGLELGPYHDRTPASLGDRFRRNLQELLPDPFATRGESMQETLAAPGRGFARLIAEIALDLQRQLGAEVRYCRVDAGSSTQTCAVFYELWDDGIARPAAALALELLLCLIGASQSAEPRSSPWNAGQERERMLKQLRPRALDLITMAMVREAVKRGIPWYRLVPGKPFVQFGQGSKQTHIRESATNHTSSTGRYLSKDKNATNAFLARVGIPVPPQRMVTAVDEAIAAAEALGFPVVTKPLDRGNGKGVSVGLRNSEGVRWGFGEAAKYGEHVIVERFVAGEDHRILVIDGRMVAAAKRIPGHVVGDGERTIAQLVDVTNADPRRGTEYDQVMVRLEFDAQAEQVLTEAGLTRDSIPARGAIVPLRRTANVSTGGTCEDVTERVHPDNRDAAIRASRVLGLNVAGVDFLSTDITRSYREIGGGICEVNFSPGLRPHWNANPGRDVVGPIVDTMFPRGAVSRIPLAALMGGTDAREACRALAHILACDGHRVGLATRHGVEIDGCLMVAGDMSGPDGARTLVFDPSVDAAVIECSSTGILDHGLALDRLDVAGILSPLHEVRGRVAEGAPQAGEGSQHGDREGLDSCEEAQAAAAKVLIQTARRAVVLRADDPQCLTLGVEISAERLVLAGIGLPGGALRAHIAAGGRAVILSRVNNDLVLDWHFGGEREQALVGADTPWLTAAGGETAGAPLCAAVALAWTLGVAIDQIRASLGSTPTNR